jgi:hypothetical protein
MLDMPNAFANIILFSNVRAFANLTDDPSPTNHKIQAVLQLEVTRRLVLLLAHKNDSIKVCSAHCVALVQDVIPLVFTFNCLLLLGCCLLLLAAVFMHDKTRCLRCEPSAILQPAMKRKHKLPSVVVRCRTWHNY